MNLCIVSPAYNESKQIRDWILKTDKFWSENKHALQINHVWMILVDDGSDDNTTEIVRSLNDLTVTIELKCLQLIKNFGHQQALVYGLKYVAREIPEADVIVTMDCDGEHPQETIPEMIKHWRLGEIMVHTIREENENLKWHKRFFSKSFYSLIRFLSALPIESGMADFKLWDASLLRSVANHLDLAGPIRLFSVYIQPRSVRLHFRPQQIQGRISRFSFRKMISLATQCLFFYTSFPLRTIGIVGLLSLLFCVFQLIYSLTMYMLGKTVPGWSSIIMTVAFFSGTNSLCLYIMAEHTLRFSVRRNLPVFEFPQRKTHD
jgi:glycosyltransferase involved in cell wall biosynthesis